MNPYGHCDLYPIAFQNEDKTFVVGLVGTPTVRDRRVCKQYSNQEMPIKSYSSLKMMKASCLQCKYTQFTDVLVNEIGRKVSAHLIDTANHNTCHFKVITICRTKKSPKMRREK